MKRLTKVFVSSAIALTMVLSFTGCGSKQEATTDEPAVEDVQEEEEETLDYANMRAEDLIADFEGKDSLTADEYIWLLSTYRYVPITDDLTDITYKDSITKDAFKILKEKNIGLPIADVPAAFLESKYAQLRGLAYEAMVDGTSLSQDHKSKAIKQLETEEDEYVLVRAIESLGYYASSDEEIGKFVVKHTDNASPKVRKEVAYALGKSSNANVAGSAEAMLKLCDDNVNDVRSTALRFIGARGDDSVVPVLEAVLIDPEQYDFHDSAMSSINDLWINYPYHKVFSEDAYNVAMNYLRQKPRTDKVPVSGAIFFMGSRTSFEDDLKNWKEKSTYYNEEEMLDLLVDIVKDPDADWMARTASLHAISKISPEKFRSIEKTVKALTDEDATKWVISNYEKKLIDLNNK